MKNAGADMVPYFYDGTEEIAAGAALPITPTAAKRGASSESLAPLFEAGRKLQHAANHIRAQFNPKEDCSSNFEARTILLRAMSQIYDEVGH